MEQILELFEITNSSSTFWIVLGFALFLVTTIFQFVFHKERWAIIGLFASVFAVGFGFAQINDYLHLWDEQFHAVVAKNLMNHPFHPQLMGDRLPSTNIWANTHTWLHKQPFFLWQMALSMKLFGTNLLALRLPSVLLHAATSVMVYSIAKRIVIKEFAWIVAGLYGFSVFLLSRVSGAAEVDHNDIAFIFYITASLWAWMKYLEKPSWKWAIIVALFASGAVLTKWLVGLLVYLVWGVCHIWQTRKDRNYWKHLLGAIGLTTLIVGSWQLYCYLNFTNPFIQEMNYNSLHLFQAVEGHGGNLFFHFNQLKNIYFAGDLMQFILLLGVVWLLIRGIRKKHSLSAGLALAWILIFIFFSFSATKMEAYTSIVVGIGFLSTFFLLQTLTFVHKVPKIQPYLVLIAPLLVFFNFQVKQVIDNHQLESNTEYFEWRSNILKSLVEADDEQTTYVVKNDHDFYFVNSLNFVTDGQRYYHDSGLDISKFRDMNIRIITLPPHKEKLHKGDD